MNKLHALRCGSRTNLMCILLSLWRLGIRPRADGFLEGCGCANLVALGVRRPSAASRVQSPRP
eukprot:684960-Pleurochrysis_carterae.AAC.1